MSRNRSDCRAHDCRHIDLHSDYDVRYWTMRFGVTESQLRSAVDITGVVADEVERFLTQWRQPAAPSIERDRQAY